MSVITMPQERRLNRSSHPHHAMSHQLEHVQALAGSRTFTLSDANGLVLACAGPREEAGVLAAYAPVLAKASRAERAKLVGDIHELIPQAGLGNIHVRSFIARGERLYLCVVGPRSARGEAEILRVLTGIRRIMGEAFAAAS